MSTQSQAQSPGITIPETPKSLLFMALLFVPGIYILLLLSLALVVGVGWYILDFLYNTVHHINRLTIVAGIAVILGTVSGIVAVIKGIFLSVITRPSFAPAIIVNIGKEPKLADFIKELCGKMNAKVPNTVILHSEPTFYVTEGKEKTFNGMARGRILAIGLPLLGGLTVNELRSILSHEFAHFTGNDTVYSSRVLPIYAGSTAALDHLCESLENAKSSDSGIIGKIIFCLPLLVPRYALELYVQVFHMLNMHISRQREFRADAVSIATCGSKCFSKAMTKSSGMIGAYYDSSVDSIIRRVCPPDVKNEFKAFRVALPHLVELAQKHAQAEYAEKEEKHSSHPSMKSRLAKAGNVPESYNDNEAASSLLTNLESYEEVLYESRQAILAAIQEYNRAV